MTYSEWKQIAKQLLAAYPNSAAQAETVVVYGEMLAHLDAAIVSTAVRRHIERSRFWPSVAEILELAEPEQAVADEHDKLPDFTGSMHLTQAEWERRLAAGMDASLGREREQAVRDREAKIMRLLPGGRDAG